MFGKILLLALILTGAAWYAGWLPSLPGESLSQATAPTLYRWQDAQGRPVYGTEPPAGVKASVVADKGQMSTVPATKIPEPPRKELPDGVTIQQLATERAINQATGGK